MDFSFFLFLYSLSFHLGFVFFLILISLMLNDSSDQFFFFISSLLFLNQGLRICFSGLFHEVVDSLLLLFGHHCIFLFHSINVSEKLHSLLISDFLLLHSLNGPFLNLINDDLGTLLSGFMLSNISLFFFLQYLQSLDFHH